MLLLLIGLYLIVTLLIGVWASRFVHNSADYMLAGQRLPLLLAASALFATWFGSETILGASSEFVQHGMVGVIEDPFGAALCLFLVGMFFAKPLYRMKILTFGDFYRVKFNRTVELVASLCLVPSYFGWIAAQFVAIGILLHASGDISPTLGMVFGAAVVVLYTLRGGMWAISLTDFMQTLVIVFGLLFLAWDLAEQLGGAKNVLQEAPEGFFRPYPDEVNFSSYSYYLAAWITIGLGSIPQQDVFQRVMSAKSAKTSVRASHIAAFMYLTIGMIPLFIGLCARMLDPSSADGNLQATLPNIVLLQDSLLIKTLFFGALISAIMSTSSGAILASASILAENIVRPYLKNQQDKYLLYLVRVSVILVAILSLVMAQTSSNIYELVGTSSSLSLVSLFVPLVAGLYRKRNSPLAAILSIVAGMSVWMIFEFAGSAYPSILPGLLASFLGFVIGEFITPLFQSKNQKATSGKL